MTDLYHQSGVVLMWEDSQIFVLLSQRALGKCHPYWF